MYFLFSFAATTSLTSAIYCLVRSLATIAVLYGFAYFALKVNTSFSKFL